MRCAAYRIPGDPPGRRRWGLVLGGPETWWVHPFPQDAALPAVLSASPAQREALADRAAAGDGIPASAVVVEAALPGYAAPGRDVVGPAGGVGCFPTVLRVGRTADGLTPRASVGTAPAATMLAVEWRVAGRVVARTSGPWVAIAEQGAIAPSVRIRVDGYTEEDSSDALPVRVGDLVEVAAEGLGVVRQRIVATSAIRIDRVSS